MDKPAGTDKQHKPMRGWLLFLVGIFALLIVLYFYGKNVLLNNGPAPSPTPIAAASGNIVVYSPAANDIVSQDFQVTGKGRVFEGVVDIRISNKITGKLYVTGTALTNAPDAGKFGDFVYNAHLNADPTLRGGNTIILEVFQASPKDGHDIDTVTIPLKFSPLL